MTSTRVLAPRRGLVGEVTVPPSKSYTHRAVAMASLATGRSRIKNPLFSRDTNATIEACRAFGAKITQTDSSLLIDGTDPRTPDDVVNVENSGTTLRFMTSILSLVPRGHSVLTGDSSIRRRPMEPLLDALGRLGVEAWTTRNNGCAPVVVKGGGMRGGRSTMKGDVSSQFVSSLLISTPKAMSDSSLQVAGAVSRPYIEATLTLSKLFGVKIDRDGYERFEIPSGQSYTQVNFTVPGDFSSASFVMAAVALVGGAVRIRGLNPALPQGDSAVVDILRGMGVKIEARRDSLSVSASGSVLRGGRFNLGDTPDLLPVVSALALKCDTPVEIVGVAHARFKETDRIAIVAKELSKLGVRIEERRDGLKVYPPSKLSPRRLDAHDDHRMFMAFSLASMLTPGGTPVLGAECLDVSYPSFLTDLKSLGARMRSD
ncbi:MAG: 3-phosphoshikimate 1-carboxyvinyltransferase [Thaumarchaeota archaeon]|nr:3-phosphoshikimate 1-carboxyvinyltransferase [Nitrososphaerota archaeon]MBI3115814.1 3-phosphoshikimate 1-carboxyvinyltransferase [Nitrososphaerota archaeon]